MLREIRRGGQIYFVHNRVENIEASRADLRKLLARSRHPRRARPDVGARARKRDARLLSPAVQRARLHDDHRERHRHPDGQYDRHRSRGRSGARAAAPAARPRRPLASPGVRVSARAAVARACRRTRRNGSKRSSRSRSSARASRSRRTISRFAARASCSAKDRAARSKRSVSRSTTSCSRALCARCEKAASPTSTDPFTHGPEIELGVAALIPEDYMPDVHMRLVHYKRIANAGSERELEELQIELIDRFGLLPAPAKTLFSITSLKLLAQRLGIAKIQAGAQGGNGAVRRALVGRSPRVTRAHRGRRQYLSARGSFQAAFSPPKRKRPPSGWPPCKRCSPSSARASALPRRLRSPLVNGPLYSPA